MNRLLIHFGGWVLVTMILSTIANLSVGAQSGRDSTPNRAIVFEVASIKPERDGASGSWKLLFDGNRFEARNESVQMLLRFAYGVDDSQITGAPSWSKTRRFAIQAKIDDQLAKEMTSMKEDEQKATRQELVRNLLSLRFNLAVREAKRPIQAYVLSVSKNGSKLRQASRSVDASHNDSKSVSDNSSLKVLDGGEIQARGLPIQVLTKVLTAELGEVVVDETALTGTYDFDLKWDSESNSVITSMSNGAITVARTPDGSALRERHMDESSSFKPSIFTALDEQLGLTLRQQHSSLPTIVVMRVDDPTEN